MDTNENIIDNLKYIGLDLNNIPERFKKFEPLEFRPSRYLEEKHYKVYKYLKIKDIQILLTPTNRLAGINEKYSKAIPISAFLDPKTEEDIERHTIFLKMLKEMQKDEVENISKDQNMLKNSIPFKVKYHKDYLWQIYYSEYTKKYFMLVPINELEQSAFFYLIKKQLENKDEYIYVPISYINYSNEYFKKKEFEDIENYLWFFTKKWPLIYEVFERDENISIHITGEISVFENVLSDYKVKLDTEEEALSFYRLLKALFILQTEVPHYYNFALKLDKKGSLAFFYKDKEIVYDNLASYIKQEYIKAVEESVKAKETKMNLEKELKLLKEYESKLEEEYFSKQKQIATFLDCKKTFFGRVRYFIKYKKISFNKKDNEINIKDLEKKQKTIHYFERPDIKEYYTIEEILELYKNLDKENNYSKNLKLDVDAINNKNAIMKKKIENATQYIKEIDEHKKSIFEFWRFTNKDNIAKLNPGKQEENTTNKLKKVFNLETDFEEIATRIDKIQRENLTKEELNAIFIATTKVLKDLNLFYQGKEILEENLDLLKKEIKEKRELLDKEEFNIFGSIVEDKTRIRKIANKKHRENPKSEEIILGITQDMSLNEYTNKLKDVLKVIEYALSKSELDIEIPIYSSNINKGLNVFHININSALENSKGNDINIYKINLKNKSHAIGFTNIVYYDNSNLTLPLGMDISYGILIDESMLRLKLENSTNNNLVKYDDKDFTKVKIKKLQIFEYICE